MTRVGVDGRDDPILRDPLRDPELAVLARIEILSDDRRQQDRRSRDPIEQRAASEVTHVHGVPIAPEGAEVANPAFDVTPHRYVTAIITERGVARAPYTNSLRKLVG